MVLAVRPPDLVDIDNFSLLFDAFPGSPPEDIDAAHVLPNGDIIFSTSTDVTQGFGGLSSRPTSTRSPSWGTAIGCSRLR